MQVGGRLKVRFGEMYHTSVIESLVTDTEVRWKCVEHFHSMPGLAKFDEWVGAKLSFRLTPIEGGDLLAFEHKGLPPNRSAFRAVPGDGRSSSVSA